MTVGLLTTGGPGESQGLQATHRRLIAVGEALGLGVADEERSDAGSLLVALLAHAAQQNDLAATWLVLVALLGGYPDHATVRTTRRRLEVGSPTDVLQWMLRTLQAPARTHGSPGSGIEIVTDRVLVDVNVTTKWVYTTGIQRVVRETAARWKRDHEVELVVWNAVNGGYRRLTPTESARFAEPGDTPPLDNRAPAAGTGLEAVESPAVLVPWGAPLILLEVPTSRQSEKLATLGEFSPSAIRLVGYDCIPVVSADLVLSEEPEKFAKYVEVVKVADRIAAISHSAAEEFAGLTSALPVQGLAAPSVTACVLPNETELGSSEPGDVAPTDRPLILAIGTLGPRKNQAATLVASEMLWRQGLDFELRLLGHDTDTGEVLAGLIKRLHDAHRPLFIETAVDDDRVAESLSEARCVVFPSLHEGFGLPVVEALSAGVPVITSDHGSLAEIAAGGGVLTIDPEDTDALAEAMRKLLTDDPLHDRLVAEARARPVRTWSDYADDLWTVLGP